MAGRCGGRWWVVRTEGDRQANLWEFVFGRQAVTTGVPGSGGRQVPGMAMGATGGTVNHCGKKEQGSTCVTQVVW